MQMKVKKYAFYSYMADNEGGYGICLLKDWSPSIDYRPWTGWRAKPSKLIGCFDSVDELAAIIKENDDKWKTDYENKAMANTNHCVQFSEIPLEKMSLEECLEEAIEYFEWFLEGVDNNEY